MVHFISKIASFASVLLLIATPGLATPGYSRNIARRSSSTCALDSLLGRIGPSSGGRKIGLVIDASNSMTSNDPEDLRLVAAKSLNSALIGQSEAANGQSADLITVVDFADYAEVLYPLGDPSGADSIIDGIGPWGGTAIGTGIQAAIDQMTAFGNSSVANNTGIVVFTDGQDDPVSGKALTISETQRAASLGIRVSFGFLTSTSQDQDIEILRAILQSGGVYATIDQASTQSAFVALVLANGLTGGDNNGSNITNTLLPGISTAKFLQTGSNTFSYAARAGETFNITVEALDPVALNITLRDSATGSDLASNSTDATGVAVVQHTALSAMNIEVAVAATNESTGVFSVGLGSSIPLNSTCNTTVIAPASPTITVPATYTGGASQKAPNSAAFVGSVILAALVACAM